MLEGSELNRTPSLYNLNAWDTQAIFLKMEMCIARCKSWSPTNKVNCLFFTTGIDRRSLTTDPLFCQADLECLYSLFTCRSIFFFVFETKKLKLSGAHTAWGHLFGKSLVKMITRSPFSYVLLSRTGWHLPIWGFKILLWLIVWRLPTTDRYLDRKITSPFVRYT